MKDLWVVFLFLGAGGGGEFYYYGEGLGGGGGEFIGFVGEASPAPPSLPPLGSNPCLVTGSHAFTL